MMSWKIQPHAVLRFNAHTTAAPIVNGAMAYTHSQEHRID